MISACPTQDMIGKMNVGMKPSEAEELFELFDTDASGGPLGFGMA